MDGAFIRDPLSAACAISRSIPPLYDPRGTVAPVAWVKLLSQMLLPVLPDAIA